MDTKYLKKVAVYIITAAASLLFIAYIIYHLWSEYNTEVTTCLQSMLQWSNR